MTSLLERMCDDMQLHGLAPRTRDSYRRAVQQLIDYFARSPNQLTAEDLRQYFLYLHNHKRVSRSTATIALCAIKFCFTYTLQRDWPLLDLIRPPRQEKLPVVLSREEVHQILGGVQRPRYRVCLATIYACGLRLREGVALQVRQIDGTRYLLHIQGGKGGKDRYVPLPQRALQLLRAYWRTHRHPVWLFPSLQPPDGNLSLATRPMSEDGVQRAFRAALHASGIQKSATVHTLRHSWATQLLEEGVNLRLIQLWLGHRSPTTTALYTHLTQNVHARAMESIDQLLAGLP